MALPAVLLRAGMVLRQQAIKFGQKQAVNLAKRGAAPDREQDDGASGGLLRKPWALLLVLLLVLSPVAPVVMVVMITTAALNAQQAAAMASACQPAVSIDATEGFGAATGSSGGGGGAAPAAGSSGGGGRLAPEEIARYAAAVGFASDDLAIAVAVALAESRGDPQAVNTQNDNGTTDYGLWQINSVHTGSGFDPTYAFDPAYNAAWARQIFLKAGGRWTPWSAYNNDSYLDFMLDAASAVESGASAAPVGSGGCGAITIAGGWPAAIEPYQPYDGQRICDPTARPGVSAFANLLLSSYPVSGNSGIVRECHIGGTSEHKEGRAFDWAVSVSNPAQRAAAEDALARILATDEHGNTHALFRRLGLMYIIWNQQIFKSYEHELGWQPYGCDQDADHDDCHVNHVHFSFSWAGALARTSFWTVRPEGRPGEPASLP